MPDLMTRSLAACAAIILAGTSINAIISVPPMTAPVASSAVSAVEIA